MFKLLKSSTENYVFIIVFCFLFPIKANLELQLKFQFAPFDSREAINY